MEIFTASIAASLMPENLLFIFLGVTLGYAVGALPGLGKGTTTAIMIPLTFYIAPLPAISFLIGIAKGAQAGSAVSAILLNTPGEPSSAPTAFDGYPMALQGKAQKALKMGLFASVIGDLFATIALIVLAFPLASVALQFGPVEVAAILLFALTFIAGLSGGSLIKGMIAGLFGIMAGTIGLEPETATLRLTFDLLELQDGLHIAPVVIGMIAISEMTIQIAKYKSSSRPPIPDASQDKADRIVTWPEWRLCLPAIARGSLIGTVIGILPGLGATLASFISYAATKRAAKQPDRFGKGAIEGIAAAESADNAVVPASLVPLFALGIPGSLIAAILIGAFMIQGITPGPLMFIEQADLLYSIYASMMCASIMLLLVGYCGQRFWVWVITIRPTIIFPSVIFLCAIGSYLQGDGLFGIGLMLVFGVFGYFAKILDYSFVTFLIGFIIGPHFELSLRQAIALTGGEVSELLSQPIAVAFLVLTAIVMWRIILRQRQQQTL